MRNTFYECKNITDVYCYAEKAPYIHPETFPNYEATLHVLSKCIKMYESASYWKKFNIVALTDSDPKPTRIFNNKTDAQNEKKYYDLQGHRLVEPSKGLYIVNGKKAIIK